MNNYNLSEEGMKRALDKVIEGMNNMKRKDVHAEMEKVKNMVKSKIEKGNGSFCAFVISYNDDSSLFAEIVTGITDKERDSSYGQMVDWLKSQNPYMFIFGIQTIERKYKTKRDMENQENYEEIESALIIGRTQTSTDHIVLEYDLINGKYEFKEHAVKSTKNECSKYLDKVFTLIN